MTTMATEYLFTEPHASALAKLRIHAREKRRLTYDCLNAIVDGSRVKCNQGNSIGRGSDGLMDLSATLRGRSSLACQGCRKYNADKVIAQIIGHRVYD